ncbi:MAG: flagellar brake domain-containing protein [Chloroflexi bacterium]|nr:flagellar brake domain-containing protein [Chloroflexota bacterium]
MIASREREVESIFEINRTVEIEVRGKDNTDRYPSRVEDMRSDTMAVSMPMQHTNLVRVPEGQTVVVSAVESDALYAIKGMVLSNVLQPVPILIIRLESGIERLQRRRYVRVATSLEKSSVLVRQGEPEEWETITVRISSLSAGGLLFKSDRKIAAGTDLQIDLRLDDGCSDLIRLCAKVARVEEETSRTGKVYSTGCYFTSIRAADEKRIVRYVFKMQIELRKRGLA